MRLIDADELISELHETVFLDGEDRSRVLEIIEEAPTVKSDKLGMRNLTKDEAYAIAEFIDINIFTAIRSDTEWDSLQNLRNLIHGYEILCRLSGYVGLTEDGCQTEEVNCRNCGASECVEKIPPADVRPVVLCGDCRWFNVTGYPDPALDMPELRMGHCFTLGRDVQACWFCGTGEHKEDADG